MRLMDNLQIDFADKFTFTDGSNFTIKVFSPVSGYKVTLKLEDKTNGDITTGDRESTTSTTKTNEWEELTIPFGAGDSGIYDRLVIFFDLSTASTNTYYFDDLKLNLGSGGGGGGGGGGGDCPAPPAGEFLSNGDFEAGDVCWQLFDGASISTTVNNGGSNSAELQGTPGPAVGLKQERFAAGSIQPNTSYTVTFDIISSGEFGDGGVFKAFVFSEGADGGTVGATQHILTDGTTSLATTWETKTFTFTTPGNANQVEGGFSFLCEIVNSTSSATINIDNVVVKLTP